MGGVLGGEVVEEMPLDLLIVVVVLLVLLMVGVAVDDAAEEISG